MKWTNFNIIIIIAIFILAVNGNAFGHSDKEKKNYLFKENKGQFSEKVLFKSKIKNGDFFLTNQGFTYSFYDKSNLKFGDSNFDNFSQKIKCHAVNVELVGANKDFGIRKEDKSSYYENYFQSNDSKKWATNAHAYNQVTYSEIYDNIDFKIYQSHENIKYDFLVKPGGNPSTIKMKYEGADKLTIENGALHIHTTLEKIIEQSPIAYQMINGEKVTIPCNFVIQGEEITFDLPEGYNKSHELVIDPVIVFSSYVNSTSDNFGFTSTFDTSGCSYVSGIVFGTGYPTSVGAYDVTWAGGSSFPFYADVAISKFTSEGDSLLYSTYLGGSNGEVPHSMVVNEQGELYVYGTTGSSNFPTLITGYDRTFNGGSSVTPNNKSTSFSNGSDIFVVKFNSLGTVLLGSTFVGGTGNDGINVVYGMNYNHGDEYRGNIVLDVFGNPYVVSTTNSTNFPVVLGSSYFGGPADAVVFKLNNNLSSLLWSTHFGGSGGDAGYGLARDNNGNIFITGGTMSSTLPSYTGSYGGSVDGFLAKYNSLGVIQTSKYVGTSSYDQSYFIETDVNDDVFIFGQSLGAMPVTSGKYNNTGTHQFIQKYNNSLSTLKFSTTIGGNSTTIDISPTAFKISYCGMIYLCGWGGTMNAKAGGNTSFLATKNAYQGSSSGSDFYIMMLTRDANTLHAATFFGGATGAEHVDGGNSKFDNEGNIYQAVCAGCNNTKDYPTTSGVWSDTSGYSNNCNAALFKFTLDSIKSKPTIPLTQICFPQLAHFGNASKGGNTYHWDFGDTTTSSSKFPSHQYNYPGYYTVSLIVSDSNNCFEPDTNYLFLRVILPPSLSVTPDDTICPNTSKQLVANGATTFFWSPGSSLSSTSIYNPVATPKAKTTYRVIGIGTCGVDTAFVTITLSPVSFKASNDTSICIGDSAVLNASGVISYDWTPKSNIINSNTSNPTVFPTTSKDYYVRMVNSDGCVGKDTVSIIVIGPPVPILTSDLSICASSSITLNASGATSYVWSPPYKLSSTTGNSVVTTSDKNITYYVDFSTKCGTSRDSVKISINTVEAKSSLDDTICFNESIELWASGGYKYSWYPSQYVSNSNSDTVEVNAPIPTQFYVVVENTEGCKDTAYTFVYFFPKPYLNAGQDQVLVFGQETNLNASFSEGVFYWNKDYSLYCDTCPDTKVKPLIGTKYIANLIDTFGCKITDSVKVFMDGSIYIPNTFTPNNDYKNETFIIVGNDLLEFEINIYNRWGEKIFYSDDPNVSWDGNFKGKPAQTGTYIWKIRYLDANLIWTTRYGHVNLLR